MNSVIEAQEEYFAYQFIGWAPGCPMTYRTFSMITSNGIHIWRSRELEKEERETWNALDRIYKANRYAQLWDQKLLNA